MPLTNKIASDALLIALDAGDEPAAALQFKGQNRDMLTIFYANAALTNLLSPAGDKIEGCDLAALIGGEAGVQALAKLTLAARSSHPARLELPVKGVGGREIWLAARLLPAISTPGQVAQHFLLLADDVTASRAAREEQDAMQRMLVSVFISVDAAAIILDDDGRIVMANPRSSGLIQPQGGLGGRHFAALLAPASRAEFEAAHKAQGKTGGSYNLTVTLTTAGDKRLDCALTAAVAQPKNNRRVRILTLQDKAGEASDGSRLFMTGKLRLIGLQDVERLFGDRWPAIREQAFTLADTVIEKALHQADQHFRSEEDGFVVIFADEEDRDIEQTTRALAESVRDELLKALDMPEVARVLSVTSHIRLSREEAKKPGAMVAALNRSLNGKFAEIRRDARTFLCTATALAKPYVDTVYDNRGRPTGLWRVSIEGKTRAKILGALAALDNQVDEFDINSLSLHLAVDQTIDKVARQGHAFLFPVSITPLFKKKYAEAYVSQCWNVPEPNRQRLLPMLTDIPEDIGAPRLIDLYRLVAPLFKGAGIEIANCATAVGDIARNPWTFVMIEARNFMRDAGSDELSLTRLIRTVQGSRAKLLVSDVGGDTDLARIKTLHLDFYTQSVGFKAQTTGLQGR